jgi:hypothetical protein
MKKATAEITTLVYFIRYKKSLSFKDYIQRDDEADHVRILLPARVLPLLNNAKNIVPLYISGRHQHDMYMWTTMVARNGDLSGFIKDLQDTGEKALLFGDEHNIRFWEAEFLKIGIRVLRYNAGPTASLSEKICYLTSTNKVIPIDDVVCMS